MGHLVRFLRFQIERWIQKGILHQLLLVGGVIVGIAIGFGLAGLASTGGFSGPREAIWWAFLRLTDPGYLGDDEGTTLRLISVIVTVLGYVLFMGSLVAIMTQWLGERMKQLEDGVTPISMRGHVVVLGWNSRTPEIVAELLNARGRLARFLERAGTRRLRIVVVAESDVPEHRRMLRAHLGLRRLPRGVFIRLGSESSPADLARFDLTRAGAIIVPGDEFRGANDASSDARTVQTVLALRTILESTRTPPQLVVELADPRKTPALASPPDERLEIVRGQAIVAQLMAQSIREPRLVEVILALLSHARGHAPYARSVPSAAGRHPGAIADGRSTATVIGAVTRSKGSSTTLLNPPPDFELSHDDRVVFLARASDDLIVTTGGSAGAAPNGSRPRVVGAPSDAAPPNRRVLVLGWSPTIGSMLGELSRPIDADVDITLVSRMSVSDRTAALEGFDWDAERIRVRHLERDFANGSVLEELDLSGFDRILIMASTGMENERAADARSIFAHRIVKAILDDLDPDVRPEVILELHDPDSEQLLAQDDVVRLVVPRILAHLEAHVALLGSLGSVFDALLCGDRLALRDPRDYGFAGEIAHRDARQAGRERGEIVIGVVTAREGTEPAFEICPSDERRWPAGEGTALVVVAAAK